MDGPTMFELTMFRADTFQRKVQVLNENGAPVNLTGGKMWFTAKFNYADPDLRAVIKVDSTTPAIIFTSPLSGVAVITVPPIATTGFPDGPVKLVYDIQFKDSNDIVTTIEAGSLTVWPDVTRTVT